MRLLFFYDYPICVNPLHVPFVQEVSPQNFERMFEMMEKASETSVISLIDAKQLLTDIGLNHETFAQIYEYWLSKRNQVRNFKVYVMFIIHVFMIYPGFFTSHCF